MKKAKTLYWIFTALFSFLMLGSAVPNIISDPVSVEGFRQISLPAYLLPFLGVAKALGVIAILIPGYPRIKEWAYAGLIFDLLGAMWSIAAAGLPIQNWAFMPIPIALGALSYIYYHKKLKLTSAQRLQQPVSNLDPILG
ncbi:MAG: DoxX-like family protein [Citrobacter freundii]|nr:MAG: DoxX-like family protein [Citrobacter freundii]